MILITGATGHVGNVLARELYGRGEKLRLLIPPGEDITPIEGLKNAKRFFCDVRDLKEVQRAVRGCDSVYHLAGIISITNSKKSRMRDINVRGTATVVEACLHERVKRLVYASSVHALRETPHGSPITEVLHTDIHSLLGPYAQSKAEATIEVLNGIQRGLDAVIVFPSGIIGPYDFRQSEMGMTFSYFAKAKKQYYIDGEYDFVDVRDVVEGLILACEKGEKGQGYILSGHKVTVREMITMVEDYLGLHNKKVRVPTALAQFAGAFAPLYRAFTGKKPILTSYSVAVLHSNCTISREKAEKQLGFKPRPIQESIADSLAWLGKSAGTVGQGVVKLGRGIGRVIKPIKN